MADSPYLEALAAAAAVELDERTRRYPGLVAGGRIPQHEAEADTRAWTAIAEFLGTGAFRWGPGRPAPDKDAPRLPNLIWTPLRAAAAEAKKRREDACKRSPGDRALAKRRADVSEIHALFDRLVACFEPRRSSSEGPAA